MKLIIAYIQPEKLNDVKQSLYAAKVYKMSVTNAMGCGQQKGYHETYRGVDIEVAKVEPEIVAWRDVGRQPLLAPTVQCILPPAIGQANAIRLLEREEHPNAFP